jgi:hypothetical protein
LYAFKNSVRNFGLIHKNPDPEMGKYAVEKIMITAITPAILILWEIIEQHSNKLERRFV